MPYYAVNATSWRHNPYVVFCAALDENLSELDILYLMWPQFVLSRYSGPHCMIMEYYWSLSRLRVCLIEIWSNMTKNNKTSQKRLCRDKYCPILSYLDTVTNTRPLYATLELI